MDKLMECPRCGRGTCYEQQAEEVTQRFCMGCGFTTHSGMKEDSPAVKQILQSSPELYKDLLHTDKDGYVWFPSTLTLPGQGMVFVDGTSKEDWKWAVVKAVPIEKKERKKFPKGQTHKMDVQNRVLFEQHEFMACLMEIGFFGEQI